MTDEPGRRPLGGASPGAWRRLGGRMLLVAAAAVIFALLVAFEQVAVLPALLAFAGFVLAAALIRTDAETEAVLSARGSASGAPSDAGLQRFADALPEPCLILDARSILVHRNAAAATSFPNLRLGNPITVSLRAPAVTAAVDAVRVTGVPQTVEMHLTLPTETWHRVSVAPLNAGDGAGILVVSMQSLTDEKRLEAMRTDFIANASHELRTPLTSLLGFIDTLTGPAAKDAVAREKFLDIMRNHALRMSKLIDDLLSLSRIEMHQHLRPTASVDLVALLKEVHEGLGAQAREAELAVGLELPAEPALATGDRDQLYEVFENLIDNALKYGADGGRVDVSLAPTARPGFAWLISVTDKGAGIAPEHVPRLTERFYRVDAESSRKKKGTGLGLAIVKHIVTRHRGALTIRSQPGQGTRVDVFLPR